MREAIDSVVIGDCTFSRRRAESLHASVMDPPPSVKILSALKSAQLQAMKPNFVTRNCSAISIASSYGEFCPTPSLIPATVDER